MEDWGGDPPAAWAEVMPIKVIARRMGISKGTVKRALAADGHRNTGERVGGRSWTYRVPPVDQLEADRAAMVALPPFAGSHRGLAHHIVEQRQLRDYDALLGIETVA